MKNRKMIICISIIITVLLISVVSVLGIKNFSGKKVDNSPKTTTTVEITTTKQEKEENSTELVETPTKSSEVKTTLKTKFTKVTKTTKKNSTNPTKKVNENKEPTISVSEPVCKKYDLPNGAVLYKDFGENGISRGMEGFMQIDNAMSKSDRMMNKAVYTALDEFASWYEYYKDDYRSIGFIQTVSCSNSDYTRGTTIEIEVKHGDNVIASGWVRPNGSIKWTYKDTNCTPERCKLKE